MPNLKVKKKGKGKKKSCQSCGLEMTVNWNFCLFSGWLSSLVPRSSFKRLRAANTTMEQRLRDLSAMAINFRHAMFILRCSLVWEVLSWSSLFYKAETYAIGAGGRWALEVGLLDKNRLCKVGED